MAHLEVEDAVQNIPPTPRTASHPTLQGAGIRGFQGELILVPPQTDVNPNSW